MRCWGLYRFLFFNHPCHPRFKRLWLSICGRAFALPLGESKLFDLVALCPQEREQAVVSAEVTGTDKNEIGVAAREEILDLRNPGAIARVDQPFVEDGKFGRLASQPNRERIGITASPRLCDIVVATRGSARNRSDQQ